VRISNPLRLLFPLVIATTGLSTACETPTRVDEHFGDAFRANKQLMVANPEAGKAPSDGINEIEGVTIEGTLERYREAQTQSRDSNFPTSILIQGMPD